jgi:hypothetical protein
MNTQAIQRLSSWIILKDITAVPYYTVLQDMSVVGCVATHRGVQLKAVSNGVVLGSEVITCQSFFL